MNSLRLRLLAMAVIGVAAALVIAGIVIVLAFDNHVRGRFTKELDDHLLQVASLLAGEPEGKHRFRVNCPIRCFNGRCPGSIGRCRRTERWSRGRVRSGMSRSRKPAAISARTPGG